MTPRWFGRHSSHAFNSPRLAEQNFALLRERLKREPEAAAPRVPFTLTMLDRAFLAKLRIQADA